MLAGLVIAVWIVTLVSAAFVYAHAFGRSVGTGVMVLGIPFYIFYYAFSQFEHPKKGLIVSSLCGGVGLGIILNTAARL